MFRDMALKKIQHLGSANGKSEHEQVRKLCGRGFVNRIIDGSLENASGFSLEKRKAVTNRILEEQKALMRIIGDFVRADGAENKNKAARSRRSGSRRPVRPLLQLTVL